MVKAPDSGASDSLPRQGRPHRFSPGALPLLTLRSSLLLRGCFPHLPEPTSNCVSEQDVTPDEGFEGGGFINDEDPLELSSL